MSGVDRALGAANLPAIISERIRTLIDRSDLDPATAADVARELIAHFEDGLAAGRSAAELLDAFGDERAAAGLIARSKRRGAAPVTPGVVGSRHKVPGQGLARHLRYAVRRMAQSPGFTAVAILSLAIGIGANAAIFSLVNAAVLRKMPVEAPEELVDVYTSEVDFDYNIFSYPDFRDVRDQTAEVFSGISVAGFAFVTVDTSAGVQTLTAETVSGQYFSLLGVEPAVGRLLGPDDDTAPGAHRVVVLGHGYWQRAYGADPGVVGAPVRIGGMEYTIVGVTPEWYTGMARGLIPDLYLPVMMINQLQGGLGDRLEQRDGHWLFAAARLAPGVTLQEATSRLDNVAAELKTTYPNEWQREDRFTLVPSREVLLYPPIDRFMVPTAGLFMALVGLVLLVACANLASFLLARTMDRHKEIAVRLALGATRTSIVAQVLVETSLLSLLGGAAGIALSAWSLRLLFAADLPVPFPLTVDVRVDSTVLVFGLAVSLLAGILFGLAPAMQSTRCDLATAMKEGSGGIRPRQARLRNLLVVGQVAVSLLLMVTAGLFVRSARATQSVDPGFGHRPAGVLSVVVPGSRYDAAAGRQFVRQLLDSVAGLPRVEAVGVTDNLHLNPLNTQGMDVLIDGIEPPEGRSSWVIDEAVVDSGFFEATGIELLRGRNFATGDSQESAAVAVISEAMERRFWPGQSALGRVIRPVDPDEPTLTVIGVARDAKVRTLGEAPRPFIYRPYSQRYSTFLSVVARTAGDPEATVRDMLRVARELDPELMVMETKTLRRHIDVMLLPARLAALVLAAFAALTLLLASVGIYGTVGYAVVQRTREVGIRVSLGADRAQVVRMLTAGGLRLVLIGAALGLVFAALLARIIALLLFGVDALDPLTFIAVPLALVGVACVAAYLPARRASRIDPVVALRSE